ncbi:thioredoxin (plasmid) [Pseudomonas silesiensis]|uniref:thioredoxin n=1 Tax=Pseudomonas silesiensis TaxID=1853130 RepID=UPI0030CFF786
MNELITATNNEAFDSDVLKAELPVLVDFWAEWCGPCRMIAPILDEFATTYKDRLKIVKVDVDKAPELAARFQVRGIPALLLFRDGLVQGNKIGALTKTQLAAFLDPLVAKKSDN